MSVVPIEESRIAVVAERVPRSVTILLVIMFAVATLLGGLLTAFPFLHLHRGVFRTMARVAPFPALVVNGDVVWYREVSERANALESLAGMPEGGAFVRAVELAIQYKVLLALADELGINVPETERDAFAVTDQALSRLKSEAGWRNGDYLRLGAGSFVLAERLEAAVLENVEAQENARKRMARVEDKLAQDVPFTSVAVQYSEGETASLGGDLGYVDVATLPNALAVFAASAAIDDISGVLETEKGFWLLSVEDVIASDNAPRHVWLRAIEIKKDLLADVLADRVGDATVVQFLR